ncbi:MAG: TMF family protein, partial [Sphingobacteriales bacterium]|nr:TMF family protein [Sphingobacteriales bacterium]
FFDSSINVLAGRNTSYVHVGVAANSLTNASTTTGNSGIGIGQGSFDMSSGNIGIGSNLVNTKGITIGQGITQSGGGIIMGGGVYGLRDSGYYNIVLAGSTPLPTFPVNNRNKLGNLDITDLFLPSYSQSLVSGVAYSSGTHIRNTATDNNTSIYAAWGHAASGNNPDFSGANLCLNAGAGVGAGWAGDIVFNTSTKVASSGTVQQALSNRWFIKGNSGIFSNVNTPDASALLDIQSTTKGILFPRMTTAQVNASANPAKGLLVFDNTVNAVKYYDGTTWNLIGSSSGSGNTNAGWSLSGNTAADATSYLGTPVGNTNNLRLNTNGIQRMMISGSTGNIGIGVDISAVTDADTYKLYVGNGIRTRKIKVDHATWPDYVFDAGYKLPSLQEVEQYILQNKHLPEIISTEEVKKDGVDLGDNQAALLKKIEELTLYMIDLNKNMIELNKKVAFLSKENQELKSNLK